jgi:hypothetical protein
MDRNSIREMHEYIISIVITLNNICGSSKEMILIRIRHLLQHTCPEKFQWCVV